MKRFGSLLALSLLLAAGSLSAAERSPDRPNAEQTLARETRCEPATGSRISRKPGADGRCENDAALLRSYEKEDLDRTGQTDLGDALRQLDPTFSRR